MFSKFSVNDIPRTFFRNGLIEKYREIGKNLMRDFRNNISGSIETYLKVNGHVDANELSDNWFPKVDADIFISHSHADEDLALILAGWIFETFELKSFIDSTVWGNISDLQRQIDSPLIMDNGNYNYHKRNQSTAYVHLLLSTALTKMMDNSEAIFFLSTNNSLKVYEENITESVWIYHEIFTSKFLRKQLPSRMNVLQKCFSGGVLESKIQDGYRFEFNLDLNDFKNIDSNILHSWTYQRSKADTPEIHSLDLLYKLFDNTQRQRIYG